MARPTGRRGNKVPACVTCLITCCVLLLITVVGLIVGAHIAFNKYVSQYIGGVTLSECNKLIKGIYRSKRDQIITEEYTEQDLDDFYKSLNATLYQSELEEDELIEGYNSLTDEQRQNISFEEYCNTHRYRITVDSILSAVDLGSLSNKNNENENQEVAAAEDGSENQDSENALTKLFKQLKFDFTQGDKAITDYPYENDAEDPTYTTFEITGSQTAAFIGELFPKILQTVDLSSTPIGDVDITRYIKLPQIRTYYTLPETDENHDKSVQLEMTIELFISQMIKEVVVPMLAQNNVPSAVGGFVKMLLPKKLYITLGVMPLDENGELYVSINNYDEKQQKNLKTIVNALTSRSGFSMFGSSEDEESETTAEETEEKSLFGKINETVCTSFTKINDYVPITFVSNEQGSVTLRMAHIQALLSMMGMYDPEDPASSVTPHMFLTTLRCLLDASSAESNMLDPAEENGLYDQLDQKYGVDRTYWGTHSLLDTSSLSELPQQIDLTKVIFGENSSMKVNMYQGEFTYLLTEAANKGFLNNVNEDTAAAAEEPRDESEFNFLNQITFESFVISKKGQGQTTAVVDEQTLNVYYKEFELAAKISLSLAALLTQNQSSDIMSALSSSLPEKLTLTLNVYIKDLYKDDRYTDFVDRIIGGTAGETSFAINNYNVEYTKKALDVIQLMLAKLGNSTEFDVTQISSKLEEAFAQVFDAIKSNLYCDILIDVDETNTGKLVLPSLYELVRGFTTQKANESNKENLTVDEIQQIFVTLYNKKIVEINYNEQAPEGDYDQILKKYDPDAVDVFLNDFSEKYYLLETIDKDKIFSSSGLDGLISIDTINFKGYDYFDVDTGVSIRKEGLYTDTNTSLEDLRVGMNGNQLCSLISSSGLLPGSLNENAAAAEESASSEFINNLSIINCAHHRSQDNDKLYLDMQFSATLNLDQNQSSDGFNLTKLVPEKVYITAQILLYSTDPQDERYSVELKINDESPDNIIKLINLFSGDEFDVSNITDTVSTSVKDAFQNIEANVNIIYDYDPDNQNDILKIDSVFNTINKLANKNNDEYSALTTDQKYADDAKLKFEIQEFGRQPSFSKNSDDIISGIFTVDHFTDNVNIYKTAEGDEFLDDVNRNMYIKEESKLTSENIESFTVSSDILDFKGDNGVFNDNRAFSEIVTRLTDTRFTALSNVIYTDGFNVANIDENTNTETGEVFGKARIIQSRIYEDKIELVVKFDSNFDGELQDKRTALPDYIFLTAHIYLTPTADHEKYYTNIYINNISDYQDTVDLFNRIEILKNTFGLPFDFSLTDIENTIKNKITDLFENYLEKFGDLNITDGVICLPNLFEYLTNGKMTKNTDGEVEYDKTVKMTEYKQNVTDEDEYTSPEVFRLRIQELGKEDNVFISTSDTRMIVWNNGLPNTSGEYLSYYNDNQYLDSDGEYFFDEMQWLYFLKNEVGPSNFGKGATSLLDPLTDGDLNNNFNLHGSGDFINFDDHVYDNLTSELKNSLKTAQQYRLNGLFDYNGAQINLKLSDKVLAYIINKQNEQGESNNNDDMMGISASELSNIDKFIIKSIKLSVNGNIQTIEMTMKVQFSNNNNYIPETFYITSITERNSSDPDNPTYSTILTLNRFAYEDFINFKANLDHLSVFGLSDKLNTNGIETAIENALRSLFDDKLSNYIVGYKNFENTANGYGYIELKNVYNVIADNTITDNDKKATLKANYNEKEIAEYMQSVIYKLNNVDTDNLLKNQGSTTPSSILPSFTDKQVAYSINRYSTIDNKLSQVVIFTGKSNYYEYYEELLLAAAKTDPKNSDNVSVAPFSGFSGNDGENPYILFTLSIDTDNISTNVSYLPATLYGSALFDEDSNVLAIFVNEMSEEEMEFFKLLVTDDSGDLSFESKLTDALNTFKGSGSWKYKQNDTDTDEWSYYGVIYK